MVANSVVTMVSQRVDCWAALRVENLADKTADSKAGPMADRTAARKGVHLAACWAVQRAVAKVS
jgi:hypothetical protein